MEKKYVLKKWVKKTLLYSALALSMIFIINVGSKMTNEAIESCVKGGNSLKFCENELKK